MKTSRRSSGSYSWLILLVASLAIPSAPAALAPTLEVGLGLRDITPELPIRLAGYAARNKPAEKVDTPLLVQAMALRNSARERMVFVALDNCEVSRGYTAPVLKEAQEKFGLTAGQVMIISSHTHSAPVLEETLVTMYNMPDSDREQVKK